VLRFPRLIPAPSLRAKRSNLAPNEARWIEIASSLRSSQ
jgi:hypothetical protein